METQHTADLQQPPQAAAEKIGPEDPRYAGLVRRGFNKRFSGKPDYVHLPGSTQQVVNAVQEALHDKLRLAARSGGHCFEGFVADPAVRALIDTSQMKGIDYDAKVGAFAVEAGATLGELYRKLFESWGVTVPAGISPDISAGGHILGGAFGFLSRQHGLAVDHLYGVEVVVVDKSGTARSVVATREPSDPNRDLYWAHTGGGGGNFGIVTRYWLRSPGTGGADPAGLLPGAPDSVLRFKAAWNWAGTGEIAFSQLLRNHGEWCERNSRADSAYAKLYSTLVLGRRPNGKIELTGMVTAGGRSEKLLDEHLAAINEGTGLTYTREAERISWLSFALYPFPDLVAVAGQNVLFKIKDAFLRKRLSDRQIEVVYRYLTREDMDVPGGSYGMATYGGKINTIALEDTASAERASILTTSCSAGWGDPQDEARNLAWVRQFYHELFSETGGVPVPNRFNGGAFINHPDADLADPQLNTSGVPWHTLYYQGNYPRLQQIKARWDPLEVFHHALSIRPAAGNQ
jgi:aclacinomycin oxidase